jgi:hypothetical protein
MTTYSGSLALRLVGAEDLFCRSAAFRKRIGAADSAAARANVHAGELTLEDVLAVIGGATLSVARPCVIIGVQSHSYVQIGQGAQIDLGTNGAVWAIFSDNARTPENHKLSMLDFVDWISQVTDQVAELVGRDRGEQDAESTLWPFSGIRQFFEPFRPDVADRQADDYWLGGYLLFDSINAGGA